MSVDDKKIDLGPRWPGPDTPKLPPGWNRITPPNFKEVLWSYVEGHGKLACNGLAVCEHSPYYGERDWFLDSGTLGVRPPNIQVLDPDGNLPLRLTRTQLASSKLPFQEELTEDIYKSIVAWAIADDWDPMLTSSLLAKNPGVVLHPAIEPELYRGSRQGYVCTADGFTFDDPYVLCSLSLSSLVIFNFANPTKPVPECKGNIGVVRRNQVTRPTLPQKDDVARTALASVGGVMGWGRGGIRVKAVRIFASDDLVARWRERISKVWRRGMKVEQTEQNWTSISSGKCGPPACDFRDVIRWGTTNNRVGDCPPVVIEYFLSGTQSPVERTRLGRILEELVGGLIIPYDPAERARRLPGAFKNLAEHISSNQEMIKEMKKPGKAQYLEGTGEQQT